MIDYNSIVPIIEAYPCINGEGKLMGVSSLLIRTTGCKLRCQFSKTDFCDSPYSSWSAEKGKFTLNKIEELIKEYPQINHSIISGGSPTMHPKLIIELAHLLHKYGHHITLETEGTNYIEDCDIDLVSLSPKLQNSIPIVGSIAPNGRTISDKDVIMHKKNLFKYNQMVRWLDNAKDYHIKPVLDTNPKTIMDFENFLLCLEKEMGYQINKNNIYIMPAGADNEALNMNRKFLVDYCIKKGYNYTDRLQIVIFGNKRGV